MIHFATSYFYQIRNFKPNMIPLSTACFSPKWFTKGIDKRGIITGLHFSDFAPGPLCAGLCRGPDACGSNSNSCQFLKVYRAQLENVSLPDLMQRCERCLKWVEEVHHLTFDNPIFVMMVYETPRNPCSERAAIQDWFRVRGIECKELTFK